MCATGSQPLEKVTPIRTVLSEEETFTLSELHPEGPKGMVARW